MTGGRLETSPGGGIVLKLVWKLAFFDACGRVYHLELLTRHDVIALVGEHAYRRAPRALASLVHEQLQFPLFGSPVSALREELLAGMKLIFAGIGEDRELIQACGTLGR
jgi:hypothetical protein